MFTAMYLGSACFTAFSGALTDRFGERTMVGVSGGVMTLALLACRWSPNYTWLVAGMGVFGDGLRRLDAGRRTRDSGVVRSRSRLRDGHPANRRSGRRPDRRGGAAVRRAASSAAIAPRCWWRRCWSSCRRRWRCVVYREADVDRPPPSALARRARRHAPPRARSALDRGDAYVHRRSPTRNSR